MPLLAGLVTKIALLIWVRILFWVMAAGEPQGGSAGIFMLVSSLGMLASVAGHASRCASGISSACSPTEGSLTSGW